MRALLAVIGCALALVLAVASTASASALDGPSRRACTDAPGRDVSLRDARMFPDWVRASYGGEWGRIDYVGGTGDAGAYTETHAYSATGGALHALRCVRVGYVSTVYVRRSDGRRMAEYVRGTFLVHPGRTVILAGWRS